MKNNIIYRVGRTGRAGTKGTAYTFITPEEDQFASELMRALELSRQEDKITPELRALAEAYITKKSMGQIVKLASGGYGGKGYKFIEGEQSKQQEMRTMEKKAYHFQ
jgi:ATP-dependent RNA helicase DDX46/PRP5